MRTKYYGVQLINEKNIALGTPTVTIYITLSGYVASVVGPCGVVVNTSD